MDVLWLHVDGCLQGAHTDHHTTLLDAQEWPRQEGETVPALNLDRLSHHKTFKGRHREPLTSHPFESQSLELQLFPLEVLPSFNPCARGAAHNSQSSKCQGLILGQDHCWVHPCMHKVINRQLQSPQAQLQSPLQMYFSVISCGALLWCVKNGSYSKKWF